MYSTAPHFSECIKRPFSRFSFQLNHVGGIEQQHQYFVVVVGKEGWLSHSQLGCLCFCRRGDVFATPIPPKPEPARASSVSLCVVVVAAATAVVVVVVAAAAAKPDLHAGAVFASSQFVANASGRSWHGRPLSLSRAHLLRPGVFQRTGRAVGDGSLLREHLQ